MEIIQKMNRIQLKLNKVKYLIIYIVSNTHKEEKFNFHKRVLKCDFENLDKYCNTNFFKESTELLMKDLYKYNNKKNEEWKVLNENFSKLLKKVKDNEDNNLCEQLPDLDDIVTKDNEKILNAHKITPNPNKIQIRPKININDFTELAITINNQQLVINFKIGCIQIS